jgi:hypothetical protein
VTGIFQRDGKQIFEPPLVMLWDAGNRKLITASAAAGLSAGSVEKLKLKWAFNLGDVEVARAQPVIIGGRLFTTAQNGAAYARRRDWMHALAISSRSW